MKNSTSYKNVPEKVSSKKLEAEIPDIFHPGAKGIRPDKTFFYYFQDIPKSLKFEDVNPDIFLELFKKQYSDKILKDFFEKSISRNGKETLKSQYLILRDNVIIHWEFGDINLLYSGSEEDLVIELKKIILSCYKEKKKKPEIAVIVSEGSGYLSTKNIKFKKPIINFQENYCDDFLAVHQEVKNQLKRKNESGLFLFYGKPGTGKSTYLRYLIKTIKKKTIFISPKMAGNLDNVEITRLLLDNKNCIIVIEDAEGLVVSRNHEKNSNLSMILNLTDGILGESLGIQIIATFNTELKNIDSALIRKGRLKLSYEFKELPEEKTSRLLLNQGIELNNPGPMTLAEIFNYTTNSNSSESQKSMGFMRN
ncbi:ATPase family protein associated with various cellular activities (AAA) [Salegentibacter sp. 24]|uniref:AAA family ATPase n=1 Tax=Salegentibacter sp. 24 TaxID=2183986 RepID=UPI00106165D4|nr:AAA family ATPase [Salegentibacter sp. 24]TDN87085.1 ATPase family protein associated with various cellular activities (AAA) [Salegentibacter sp. 24]